MKRRWMLATLMLVLAGCGGSAVPGGGRCNKGLCVKIEVVEPVRWGESIGVTITVSSERDIRGLGISLLSYPPSQITFEKAEFVTEGGARWATDIQANHPQHFGLSVYLPLEGNYVLIAQAHDPTIGMVVADEIRIYLTRKGGVVNPTPAVFSGTPALVPTMPPEWLRTPFPTPTPLPTLPPSPLATPTREGSPFRSPLPTPTSAEHP
jgi:hypothetical protein